MNLKTTCLAIGILICAQLPAIGQLNKIGGFNNLGDPLILKVQVQVVNPYKNKLNFSLSSDNKSWTNFSLKPSSNRLYSNANYIRFDDGKKGTKHYRIIPTKRYKFTRKNDRWDLVCILPRKSK